MYAGIYIWVRAGLRDCQLLTNIVGETRPYKPLTYIIVFMRMQSPIPNSPLPIPNSPFPITNSPLPIPENL